MLSKKQYIELLNKKKLNPIIKSMEISLSGNSSYYIVGYKESIFTARVKMSEWDAIINQM